MRIQSGMLLAGKYARRLIELDGHAAQGHCTALHWPAKSQRATSDATHATGVLCGKWPVLHRLVERKHVNDRAKQFWIPKRKTTLPGSNARFHCEGVLNLDISERQKFASSRLETGQKSWEINHGAKVQIDRV